MKNGSKTIKMDLNKQKWGILKNKESSKIRKKLNNKFEYKDIKKNSPKLKNTNNRWKITFDKHIEYI